MNERQVQCTTKSPAGSKNHQHITHIGGRLPLPRYISTSDAIVAIRSNPRAFFTIDPSTKRKAYVEIIGPTTSNPYLRTVADGIPINNLIELPECY